MLLALRSLWETYAAKASGSTPVSAPILDSAGLPLLDTSGNPINSFGGVLGVGVRAAVGAGSSAGVATVSGASASGGSSSFSAAGVAAVSGVSIAGGVGVASSVGAATVSGVTAATGDAAGSSAGVASVAGVGAASGTIDAVGTASGTATVIAFPGSDQTQFGGSAKRRRLEDDYALWRHYAEERHELALAQVKKAPVPVVRKAVKVAAQSPFVGGEVEALLEPFRDEAERVNWRKMASDIDTVLELIRAAEEAAADEEDVEFLLLAA